jgi:hypothetical protein
MSLTLKKTDRALWWENGLRIDADGAPNAYGPPGSGALDYLANAGGPGNWYGIVTDADGNPVVQGAKDPCPGMYISPTSLQDKTKGKTDPRRYVDSTTVPYLAIPRNAVTDHGLKLGDVGLAYCRTTGQASAAIVADIGPKNKWGEGSIALAKALGINDNAKRGGTDKGVVVVVFKGTSKGWPRTNEDIAQQVQDVINELGGFQQFLEP